MRIGFDARRATSNFTGLGNYSRSLIQGLAVWQKEFSLILFTSKIKQRGPVSRFLESSSSGLRLPQGIWKNLPALWRSAGIAWQLKDEKIDIYHGLSAELPLFKPKGCRFIVTVHDLIFLRFPSWYKPIDRAIYFWKLKKALSRADHVIAISEQTRNDLLEYTRVKSEKVSVIYQACAESFRKTYTAAELDETARLYGLEEPFILCVGTLEERKNQLLVLKAFARLHKAGAPTTRLLVVGKKTAYYQILDDFVLQAGLAGQVSFLENVPEENLAMLYQLAAVFVYPSRFEGFGIPILEALSSGLPVISSTGSCFREAGGPDSMYIEPDDDAGLAQALARVLGDEGLRRQMQEKGRIFAQKFLPATLSARLADVYRGNFKSNGKNE